MFSIPVDSIAGFTRLVQHKEGHFEKSAQIGSLVGAAAGALLAAATYEKPDPKTQGWFTLDWGRGGSAIAGGLIGVVAGGVIGGVAGASDSETYNLKVMTLRMKLQIIEGLLVNERTEITSSLKGQQ